MIDGTRWRIEIGDTDKPLIMLLSFLDGHVYENGLPIGKYTIEQNKVIAALTDNCLISFQLEPPIECPLHGSLVFKLKNAEAIEEPARLYLSGLIDDAQEAK